ncbi:MAG: galactofuranosyltransferase, partial [Liquorilactobacillus ghanensis]
MKNVIMSSIVNKNNKDAGPKAKNDIEKILVAEGFQPLNLELSRNKFKKLLYALVGLNKVFKGKEIDNLVFQYPIYSIFLTQRFIHAI